MKYKFKTDIDLIEEMISECFVSVDTDEDIHRMTIVLAHIPKIGTEEFAEDLQIQMEVTGDVDDHVHLHEVGDVMGGITDEGSIYLDAEILETQIQEMLEYMYRKKGGIHLSKFVIALFDNDRIQVHLKIKRFGLVPTTDGTPMQISIT